MNFKPDSRALSDLSGRRLPRLFLRGGHARIIRPARVRAPRTPPPNTQHLQMARRVRRRGLRLAQPRARAHRQHQPLIRHLNELRTRTRVTQQATLQLQQHHIKRRQQLVVRTLRQTSTELLNRTAIPVFTHVEHDRRSRLPPALPPRGRSSHSRPHRVDQQLPTGGSFSNSATSNRAVALRTTTAILSPRGDCCSSPAIRKSAAPPRSNATARTANEPRCRVPRCCSARPLSDRRGHEAVPRPYTRECESGSRSARGERT